MLCEGADMSEKAIGREVTLQELEKGFQGNGIDGISIKQLLPKVSMQAFKVKEDNPKWDNWKDIFKEEKCKYYFNEEKNILIIIEAAESKLEWSSYREISNLNWELYLIYYNREKRVAFINSSVKGSASKIADSIFPENDKVKGECIFRCLYGINRLMLGTVGLNSAINGPIRYKMFAGIDIAQGINEAQKSTSTKSNLFGIGYNGNGKISIGCSYKGTVWSRWVESIDFWIDWCNQIIDKIFDTSIDVEKILEGVLIPKEISKIPKITPYRIDWPIELDLCNDLKVSLNNYYHDIALLNSTIKLAENNDMINVIDRMIKRENKRINDKKTSRFEEGDFEVLGEIKNRLKLYPASLKIFVVQPGVDGESITNEMHQVLMASRTYLQETYGIEMNLICS